MVSCNAHFSLFRIKIPFFLLQTCTTHQLDRVEHLAVQIGALGICRKILVAQVDLVTDFCFILAIER